MHDQHVPSCLLQTLTSNTAENLRLVFGMTYKLRKLKPIKTSLTHSHGKGPFPP